VYYPGFTYHVDGGTKSYGSVTYAGVLSYTYANVKKDDQRVKGAVKWISDNYTVDENPGMGQKTVFYYYMVFAKALAAIDQPTIVDARGRSHNWREELGRKLLSLQNAEGYWVNTVPDEMQDNKVLVTTFTMTAIQALLQ
jgi:squalene-hopene/tetraprenyl-beta-curcumene cyclase